VTRLVACRSRKGRAWHRLTAVPMQCVSRPPEGPPSSDPVHSPPAAPTQQEGPFNPSQIDRIWLDSIDPQSFVKFQEGQCGQYRPAEERSESFRPVIGHDLFF
jgi:hypothetical protein